MAGGIPEEVIERIRTGTDIVGLISEYISLRQNGPRYIGLCPFHNEKTPSFSVSRDKQLYYCFGCHASGNAISFVMNMDGMSFVEAVRKLGLRMGIDVSEHLESDTERQKRQFREKIIDACEVAAKYYSWMLTDSKLGDRCRRYVEARGIGEEAVKAFGLGYAPQGQSMDLLVSYLAKKGFDDKTLLEAGLALKKKFGSGLMDAFRDRLMFPIRNSYGKAVAFGGRIISDDGRPKYINSKEGPAYSKRSNLYNLHLAVPSARSTGRMVLCEGYLDVIAVWNSGVKEVVASLGTALTLEQSKLIARHAGTALLSYDADSAGSAATSKGVKLLEDAGLEVKIVMMPSGEDPDSLYRKAGALRLKETIDAAASYIRFQIESAMAQADISSRDGKLAAARKVVAIIASSSDAVTRAELVREISGRLAVAPDAMSQDVTKLVRRQFAARGQRQGTDETEGERRYYEASGFSYAIAETERAILGLCAKDPKLIKMVLAKLPEGFEAEGSEELYKAMASLWDDGKEIDERLLAMLHGRHREMAAKLLLEAERPFGDIDSAIEALKVIKARRRLRDIDVCIRKAEAEGKTEDVEPLQREQKELRDKLGNRTALY